MDSNRQIIIWPLILLGFAMWVCFLPIPALSAATTAEMDGGGHSPALTGLLSVGLSLGLGYLKKRVMRAQWARNAIPITNSAVMATGAAIATGDVTSTVAAVAGSLVATGIHQIFKQFQ